MAKEQKIEDVEGAGEKNDANKKVMPFHYMVKMGQVKFAKELVEHGVIFITGINIQPFKVTLAVLG